MKKLLIASCVAAAVAAPLAAQTQSPGTATESPRPALSPAVPETADAPRAGTIDAPAGRPGGRISETAPAPRAESGAARFRADLDSCKAREPESQASCRQEMHAARAQGLYRNY